MFAIGRRKLLLLSSAALLAACNGSGDSAAAEGEMAIGAADAPATLIEYASTTCPHCAAFHAEVFDQLKENYIDTGKLRFIFREFPTPPPQVALAGFQLARCGGADAQTYLTRVGVLFEQQRAIFESGTMEGVRAKFVEIGGASGLSEEQVMACISDPAGQERVQRTVAEGQRQFDITGTPTLILNGQKLTDASALTYDGLARAIDAAIAG